MASTAWSRIVAVVCALLRIRQDKAFVLDLEDNQHSMAIARAVIDLGHSLGIPVLAEAVETVAQHARLLERGCDEVQGYLVGRPTPIDNYAALAGLPGATRAKPLKAS